MANDLNGKFSIDEILNDVKRMTGQSSDEGKLWSLSEIDALLADEKAERQDSAETEEEKQTDESQFTGLKDFAINNVIDDSFDGEEAPKEESRPSQAAVTEPQDDVEFSRELTDEIDEPVESFIDEFTESAQDDIEPLIDGVNSDEEDDEQEPEQQETDEVPGQISIEKTRVFNEIDTRAVKNENVDHQIGVNKIIRTGEIPVKSSMEQDPYRERFFNKPELNIEKTQDHRDLIKDLPQKTIEKTGVIVKKPQFEKTGEDGLSPVPTLVDPAEEYDAIHRQELQTQQGSLHRNAFEDDNQMMLEGFGEEEEVEIVSEAQTEENLRRLRKEKAKNFKLFPNLLGDDREPESDGEADGEPTALEKTRVVDLESGESEEGYNGEGETDEGSEQEENTEERRETVRVAREFFGPKDSHAVYNIYIKEKSRKKLKVIVAAAALAVLLLGTVTTSFLDSFALFAGSPSVYSAVNIIVLLVLCAFNYDAFPQAVEKAKRKKANSASALSLALAVGVFQSAVSLAFSDLVLAGTHIYAAVAAFAVLMINIGDYIKVKTDLDNFLVINDNRDGYYAVKAIDDEDVAFEIGRGLMIKEPDIRYSSRVNFPYKFVEMSKTVDPTAGVYTLVLPVALLAAFTVGLFSWLINKNLFVGITSFSGVLLMAVPSAIGVSLFGLLRRANRSLNDENGLISGYEAVEDTLETNAVVVDASDLFSQGEANIYGIKLFNSMRIDEAILYTAAVVMQSNGALSDVFNSIILSNNDMLPTVESLAYEEKLGCSGWIYNYRVLVGNRDLLIKHNVEVQSKEEEARFTSSGKQLLYLAVEGKVSAMFVVGYGADESIAKYLRSLEKSGINILVRTTDPNITEELVEQSFGLPRNFIKVISPVAGVMYSELSGKEAVNEPCRILHNGKIKNFLSSFVTALSLNEKNKIAVLLQYIGIAIGILLMAMFSFTSGMNQAGAVQMILFEAIWSLAVIFIPTAKRN